MGDGILNGSISIDLEPEQVIDEVGSDRVNDWANTDDLQVLVENIRKRGQKQPIMVRPKNPDWRPDSSIPLKISPDEVFVIQSGRRRMEACRKLGIKVRAFCAPQQDEMSLRLQDLYERLNDNMVRNNLCPWEFLLSVGTVTSDLQQTKPTPRQAEIADLLQVNRSYISTGLQIFENREALVAQFPSITTGSHRDIRNAIFMLDKNAPSSETAGPEEFPRPTFLNNDEPAPVETRGSVGPADAENPARSRRHDGGSARWVEFENIRVKTKLTRRNVTFALPLIDLDDQQVDRLAAALNRELGAIRNS